MFDAKRDLAIQLFQEAYTMQMSGEYDIAVDLYKRSIEVCPTAEAHTFLGWTYRRQGKLDQAIDECKAAIECDPSLGNPYNDIGAYLIEKGQFDAAIPFLEKAIDSTRYEEYHFPWYNLGRVYAAKEMFTRARECFQQALDIEPGYAPAAEAIQKMRVLVQ